MAANFNVIWDKFIRPLAGQPIATATGRKNLLGEITNDYLERISSKGKKSTINKLYFEKCYIKLIEEKVLTRSEINNTYGKRCSSIVVVILANAVPGIKLNLTPVISLEIEAKKNLK